MKLNFLFSFVISLNISAGYSNENLVAIAIKEYAESTFVKNGKTFEIVHNSKNVSLVDETIKLLGGFAYRVTQVDTSQEIYPKLNTSAIIIIFDNLKSFTIFDRYRDIYLTTNYKIFLIVCPKFNTSEVLRNLPRVTHHATYQFLIEEKGQIYLKKLTLFTPQACHQKQLIEVNRFSKKKLKWTNKEFFDGKIDNFHGCTLKVCHPFNTFLESEYNWTTTEDGKVENIHMEGYLFNLAKELSLRLNFTMETWLFDSYEKDFAPLRFLNLNEKKEYNFGPDCDWYLRTFPASQSMYELYTLSKPVSTDVMTIIVPPGAFYTSEEKFLLPFDELTWILLALVFASAFSVVFLVRLSRSYSIAEFVIGENVSTPGLNIVAAFMGVGQLSLPARNIARILLMNFVIFSLIMRTAYQGVYFQFLTTNPQKKPISSMEEIVKKNLPVYTESKFFMILNDDFYDPLRVVPVYSKDLPSYYSQIQNSSFEGCILETTIEIEKVAKYHDTIKFNYVEVNFWSSNSIIVLPQSFNPKVVDSGFIDSGIIENWSNRIKYFAELKVRKAKASNLVVLSMDHLSTGFIIWLCALSLSVIAFIAELCHFHLNRIWIRLTRSNRISFVA